LISIISWLYWLEKKHVFYDGHFLSSQERICMKASLTISLSMKYFLWMKYFCCWRKFYELGQINSTSRTKKLIPVRAEIHKTLLLQIPTLAWVASLHGWLRHPSFILEIHIQISAQRENIFLLCWCYIWIQICRVLTLEHCFLIYVYFDQKCCIPLGMLPKTLNHKMYVQRDHLKMQF
jgi:hypothetical protein